MREINEQRTDVGWSGQFDPAAMRKGPDDPEAKSEGMIGGTISQTSFDFVMPTCGAAELELGHLPTRFGLIKEHNYAVVTIAACIKGTAIFERGLIRGMAIKACKSH